MKEFNKCVLVLFLIPLSGCTYLGGFFNSKDECKGAACTGEALVEGKKSNLQWYCYGKEDASDWQCENSRDPSKIVAVVPKSRTSESRYRKPAPVIQPESAPSVPKAPKLSNTVSSGSKVDNRKSLMDEPVDSFAVQLVASPEKEKVLEFAKSNDMDDPLYVRINHQGGNWYVLLLGIYTSRTDASEAKESWMKNRSVKTKPWIRELGPLQEAVRAAGNG